MILWAINSAKGSFRSAIAADAKAPSGAAPIDAVASPSKAANWKYRSIDTPALLRRARVAVVKELRELLPKSFVELGLNGTFKKRFLNVARQVASHADNSGAERLCCLVIQGLFF
jgi:hypothetical protein